jgi:crotonobetainyl-CoA:carnitine CoA-transferase CaiB-like acyl-CoA transferase
LRQLGVVPEEVVAATPGKVWVSITGYGRDDNAAERVAFGDDAAVAGGLVAWDASGAPVFCGDALADPLTGLCAAAGVAGALARGGGVLLDVAMADVSACFAAPSGSFPAADVARAGGGWEVRIDGARQPVLPPRAPAVGVT